MLKSVVTAYVEAQRSGNLTGMPIADNARCLENMEANDMSDGLWNTAMDIDHDMNFHDSTRGKTLGFCVGNSQAY